jgi:hypothetical protein
MANGDFEARENSPGFCFFLHLRVEFPLTDAVGWGNRHLAFGNRNWPSPCPFSSLTCLSKRVKIRALAGFLSEYRWLVFAPLMATGNRWS